MLTAGSFLQEADLVSVLLGLLINLAEGSRSNCRRLLGLTHGCTSPGPRDTACRSQANAEDVQPASLLSTSPSQQQDLAVAAEVPSLLQLLCLLTQVPTDSYLVQFTLKTHALKTLKQSAQSQAKSAQTADHGHLQ